jgi:3-carboxy-cis,cis-muconate cycloisomerase
MTLYDNLFYSKKINQLFSDKEMIGAMLRFEATLAEAQGELGIVPTPSVLSIKNGCKISLLNITVIKNDILLAGNAAIPLVKELIRVVKVHDAEAAKYVHFGATSQDVIDTAMVLQLQKAIVFFEKNLKILQKHLINGVEVHKNTVMIGRTLLQQARPITFGLKMAYWLEGINRSIERLSEMKKRVLVLQLGGAVGSLSGMDGKGLEVAETMSKILDLTQNSKLKTQNLKLKTQNSKPIPTHTQRDNFAEVATTLGILMGTLGKIAKDVTLMMQTEVGEVFEGAAEGKGGSSTMPHKRNPVTATAILANANRVPALVSSMLSAMVQEYERSAGLWHSEWAVLPEIVKLTAGALERSIDLIAHLEVDKDRMLENINATNGLIFAENISLALAPHIGKPEAHDLVEKACKMSISKKQNLKAVLEHNEIVKQHIPPSVFDGFFDPKNSIGLSLELVDNILNQK